MYVITGQVCTCTIIVFSTTIVLPEELVVFVEYPGLGVLTSESEVEDFGSII